MKLTRNVVSSLVKILVIVLIVDVLAAGAILLYKHKLHSTTAENSQSAVETASDTEIECDDRLCIEKKHNAQGKEILEAVCYSKDSQHGSELCKKYRRIKTFDYDQKGRKIAEKICNEGNIGADGKLCDRYDELVEYEYDEAEDLPYIIGSCDRSGISADGKSCSKYNKLTQFSYDKDMVFKDVCSGENIDTENKSCKSAEEKEIKVFDQGVLVSSETCYRGRDGSCEFNRKIEYDSDKKGHYRMILSDYAVTDYTYDDDKLTSIKICSKRNGMSADGQSCDRYYGIEDYAYDQSGRQISHRICRDQDISADGKTCDKYSEEYEYGYDIVGNLVSIRDKGWYYDKNCEYVLAIKDYSYDAAGNVISIGELHDEHKWIREYSYDAAGNVTSVKKCNLYNVQLGTDRKSCDKYNETVAYNYDAAGNRTSIIIEWKEGYQSWSLPTVPGTHSLRADGLRIDYTYDQSNRPVSRKACTLFSEELLRDYCGNVWEGECETAKKALGDKINKKSCGKYDEIVDYGYDEEGKLISQESCQAGNISPDGTSCSKYEYKYSKLTDIVNDYEREIKNEEWRPTLRGPVDWPSYRMHLAGPWAEYYLQCFGDEAGGKEKLADPAHWKKSTASSIWLDTGF